LQLNTPVLKPKNDIPSGLFEQPFSLKRFVKENINGILGTLAFHLVILIVLLFVKIQSLPDPRDLDLVFDYSEPPPTEEELAAIALQQQRDAYYERLLEQQLRASNRAVNVSEDVEEKISTENYVKDVMKALDEARSEEWRREQEEIRKMLEAAEKATVAEDTEEYTEESEFEGPTTIAYEFIEAPFDRRSVRMPVPVYKCRGGGVVEVAILVNRLGEVTSLKAKVISASHDPDCLARVSEEYARRSRFSGSSAAPESHAGKITYTFIAQ
jgi:hypothetical protein